jgi:hypothetical protein
MRWAGYVDWKRPFGRPRHSWDNIRINLKDFGWKGMNWINVAHGSDMCRCLMSTVMNMQ